MTIIPSVADASARAIIDASSAILLYKAGLIDISCQMVQLLMTRSVFAEVTVPGQIGARRLSGLAGRQPGIIVLGDPCNSGFDCSSTDIERLHRGERDTLKHYLNAAAPFVIIDDGRAVRICRRHGIPHINALLVPKLMYFSGRLSIEQMEHFFARLRSIGRYSDDVVDWAKGCGTGQLDFFLVKMGIKMGRR